jgi:hypothetical protein
VEIKKLKTQLFLKKTMRFTGFLLQKAEKSEAFQVPVEMQG